MLVIIIICPLATSEAVMVTRQLNQTAIKDRQQLLRLMLFWRWKREEIPSLTEMQFLNPTTCMDFIEV